MYQALPYKTWHTTVTNFGRQAPLSNITNPQNTTGSGQRTRENMKRVVNENAVVVIGRRGCCMSHVVTRLLFGLGVNPAVHEVDEQDEVFVMDELEKMPSTGGGSGGGMNFPAVFVGGRWFGGLDRVMATHITGELTPILRGAGALWL